MNCKYCGGRITLETKECPSCGMETPFAKQHAKDMERFEEEFRETKEYVKSKTGNRIGFFLRLAILFFIMIAFVIVWVIAGNAYSVARESKLKENKAKMDQNIAVFESYLAEEDYLGAEAFFVGASFDRYDMPCYDEYHAIYVLLSCYADAYYQLTKIISAASDTDTYYKDHIPDYIGYMSDDLQRFYEAADPNAQVYKYDEITDMEKLARTKEGIERQLFPLLETYLGFTKEDLEEFESWSAARRQYVMEERYYGTKE